MRAFSCTAVAHICLIYPRTELRLNVLKGVLTSDIRNENLHGIDSRWTASFDGLYIDTAGTYRIRVILGLVTRNGVVLKEIRNFNEIHIIAGEGES